MYLNLFKWVVISHFILSPIMINDGHSTQHPTTAPLEGSQEAIDQTMQWLTDGLDPNVAKRISERGSARYYITLGGSAKEYTDNVVEFLGKAKEMAEGVGLEGIGLDVPNNIINIIGSGIAQSLTMYGRYTAASILQVMSSHEQIVEAAKQSHEKIQELNSKIKGLLAFNKDDLKIGGLRDVFSWKLFNNLNVLTDSLYITDYKAVRGDALEEALNNLKIEKEKFNHYLTILKIKTLENELMDIHKKMNKNAYITAMKRNLDALLNADKLLYESIELLNANKKNHIDDYTRYYQDEIEKEEELMNRLISDRKSIVAQIGALQAEINMYKEITMSPADEDKRNKLIEEIADLRKTLSPGEQSENEEIIEELSERVKKLEDTVQHLRENQSLNKTPAIAR